MEKRNVVSASEAKKEGSSLELLVRKPGSCFRDSPDTKMALVVEESVRKTRELSSTSTEQGESIAKGREAGRGRWPVLRNELEFEQAEGAFRSTVYRRGICVFSG